MNSMFSFRNIKESHACKCFLMFFINNQPKSIDMKKYLFLLGFLVLSISNMFAQTVAVDVQGTNLYFSDGGCSDCVGLGDQPDPYWLSRIVLNGTNYDWNKNQDNGNCGWRGHTNTSWVSGANVPLSGSLQMRFDGYELDNTFLVCDGNDNVCGGYSTLVDIGCLGNYSAYDWHSFQSQRVCDGGDYRVEWRYKWYYIAPPTISQQPDNVNLGGGARSLCVGTPVSLQTTFATVSCGLPVTRFVKWQSSPNGTTWTDISGALSSSYTPPQTVGTIYYRCVATNEETAAYSNSSLYVNSNPVTITYYAVADLFCTAPSCDYKYVSTFGSDVPTAGS